MCSSAQRLSASLNSALTKFVGGVAWLGSAQRLSASLNSARSDSDIFGRGARCSTPFGITEFGTVHPGLAVALGELCSTPFGITEFGTRGEKVPGRQEDVLNAFRHH